MCTVYFGLHLITHASALWFEVSVGGVAASIWYAPAGLALSLMVVLGPRFAGVVFAANWVGALVTGGAASFWFSWLFPALITANYATAAWWVRRMVGVRLLPGDLRETGVFLTAIVVAPLMLAIVGTTVAMSGRPPSAGAFWQAVLDWWTGDASGLLTVVPMASVFVAPWVAGQRPGGQVRRWSLGAILGAAGSGGLLLGSVAVVLAVPVLRGHFAFFVCFLPLVWICVRYGMPGAALATLGVTLTGLAGMRFIHGTADFAYVYLLFVIAVAGVGLGLGAMVSKRQAAEAALAESQAQLDRVIVGAQAGLWDLRVTDKKITTNDWLAGLLGYAPEEIEPLTEHWERLVHPADYASVKQAFDDHLAGSTPLYEEQIRLRTKAGQWHWVLSRGSVMDRDASGQPLWVSGLFVDIHERKQAEAEIRRLFRIIEATPDCIFTTDIDGRIHYANAALSAAWGEREAGDWVGRSLSDVFDEASDALVRTVAVPRAMDAGLWQGELEVTLPSGKILPVGAVVLAHRDAAKEVALLSFTLRDLTLQKRAEAERVRHERELMQVQKDESLSVLAGGIAHDFNNLMTSVLGSANLARLDVPEGSDLSESIDTIERAAVRAAALCQQMLAYAGRSPVQVNAVDFNQVVSETLQLLESSLSEKIRVRFFAQQPMPPVLAAQTQAQQIVMNLVLNAAAAMEDEAGEIVVRTQAGHWDAAALADFQRGDQRLPPGSYFCLEVKDTGRGMTPEQVERIFEPFFTTKFTGSGLGLAVVMGFVRGHRGGIAVKSEPGQGSTFRLVLPQEEVAAKAGSAAPMEAQDRSWRGDGVVLLADDEPSLRRVAGLMLDNLGFEVITAPDGRSAVEVFEREHERLTFVLLDITMPELNGLEAHAAMHALNPNVPVILMSGYSQKLANLPPSAIHPAGVLAKPFSLGALRDRLRSVLTQAV